ncbi:MAG: hypothetical protein N2512_04560 [Armatimonadetes bacterium]|nr:hypothetical protein [Armatimonadota bacterium]
MKGYKEPHLALKQAGVAVTVALCFVFLYLLFVAGQTGGLTDINAIECAIIARNIARTGHYATDILKPLSLACFPVLGNHPDTIYPPLHPLWEALWLKLLGYSERAVPLACGFWLLAGAGLILWLGTRWFDFRVGAAGAAFYALNAGMMERAAGGTEIPLLGFELLVLLAAAGAYFGSDEKPALRAAALGGAVGLLYLTSYAWGLALIPVVVAVGAASPQRLRWWRLAACTGAFLVVVSPWLVRNTVIAGSPFFTLSTAEYLVHTQSYSGNTLYRTFTTTYPSWVLFALTSPREAIAKVRMGLENLYVVPLTSPGPYVGALFITSLLVQLGPRAFELSRYVLYGAGAAVSFFLIAVGPEARALHGFAAPATLMAAALLVRLLDTAASGLEESKRRRVMLLGLLLFGAVQCTPTLVRLASGRPPAAVRADSARVAAREVAALVDGLVATDLPWPLAWHGNVKVLWLPVSRRELDKVEEVTGPVKWLLLTPLVHARRQEEKSNDWARMWAAALERDVFDRGFATYRHLPGQWVLFRRTTIDLTR